MQKTFTFSEQIFIYPGKAAWHFVTVPTKIASEIDYYFEHAKRGWGSLRVSVLVGRTTWETSIFPNKKTKTYLLPLKSAVRTTENLVAGKNCTFALTLADN